MRSQSRACGSVQLVIWSLITTAPLLRRSRWNHRWENEGVYLIVASCVSILSKNARGEAANPANLSLVLVWSSPRKWSASIKKIRVPSRVVQVFISAWCSQGMETHSLNKQLTQCATWLVQSFSHCGIFTSEHRRVDGKQKTLRNHDKLRKCDKWQAASGQQHDNVLSNIPTSFWLEEREENIDQWVLVKGSLVSHGVLYLILQSNDSLCSSVFIIPSFTKASNQSNN